ncbi:MAG TPA: O-acetyl-ADP-ribose deacetylase [Candidatus Spyradenecus faecavium]|uniref:O-acetyl-ADP-ribose deacetylase n=1 Tax=Candidatus Spyradenecus faecavium TaxID=2840947 RepID=A0A9D1NNM4_9BACT|nr:O-acetyl-ADP-ribose deacetylase [Candidatus Spyradenecus faecavium]
MPLNIIRDDLTRVKADALVTAANEWLAGGGGVDGAIHRAAGPELLAECAKLGGCPTGEARITGAGRLPCKFVIHAVGPVWEGGTHGERELLASCYRAALTLAVKHKCKSVAFPLISAGVYGYPKEEALRVAVETIGAFLRGHELEVTLVLFDAASFQAADSRFADIKSYIDDRYVGEHEDAPNLRSRREREAHALSLLLLEKDVEVHYHEARPASRRPPKPKAPLPASALKPVPLETVLGKLAETFSQRLLRLIRERGLTDVEAYRRANVSRKVFSKIRSNKDYHPSRATACAFVIALGLSADEARALLLSAGLALSNASKFDLIVQYFVERGETDVLKVNEALFSFGQPLLGGA